MEVSVMGIQHTSSRRSMCAWAVQVAFSGHSVAVPRRDDGNSFNIMPDFWIQQSWHTILWKQLTSMDYVQTISECIVSLSIFGSNFEGKSGLISFTELRGVCFWKCISSLVKSIQVKWSVCYTLFGGSIIRGFTVYYTSCSKGVYTVNHTPSLEVCS